ncbi:MAG: dihydrolipoamide acetyltransferase family protein [Anaerolineaceae bacterium]
MPTPFIMPKMDMDQESVTIIEWLKKEGDIIKKGEPVISVETDKITSEVEAPESGTLAGILYHENEEAPVTKVVAYILGEGETVADLPTAENKQTPKPKGEVVGAQLETPAAAPSKQISADLNVGLVQTPETGQKESKVDVESLIIGQQGAEPSPGVAATPAAKRAANEAGLRLESISGTGPRGRIQENDVSQIVGARPAQPQKTVLVPGASSIPMVGKRKRIAERMTASYQTAPHIYLTVEVDMSAAEISRKHLNALAEKQGKSPISVTAYLVKMAAWALKRHPYLNASLLEDQIQLWNKVNVGVATALEEGLIVPVIHEADNLTISEINEQLRYLTKQARSDALTHEEVDGGTFTISNLGMYGIKSFTAIINPPQSAILAVGGLERRAVVVDDKDTISVRPILTMTLGADHRVVDGAEAAAFLADLVSVLETPDLILF